MEPYEETSGNMVQDPRTITDLGEFVDSLVATTKGTIRAERDHLSFMLAKRVADTVRKLTGSLASVMLFGLALLMASICGAYLLGQELGNIAWGFGIMAGAYVVLGIVFGSLWKGSLGKSFTVDLINSFHGH
jgi:hypothetical protein